MVRDKSSFSRVVCCLPWGRDCLSCVGDSAGSKNFTRDQC